MQGAKWKMEAQPFVFHFAFLIFNFAFAIAVDSRTEAV
jgi:hypothetical protein